MSWLGAFAACGWENNDNNDPKEEEDLSGALPCSRKREGDRQPPFDLKAESILPPDPPR